MALVESIWVEGVTGENLQGIHSPPAPAALPSPSSSSRSFSLIHDIYTLSTSAQQFNDIKPRETGRRRRNFFFFIFYLFTNRAIRSSSSLKKK